MELVFPLRGIDDGWAFSRQPEGTTPDCQNVCPFDLIHSRARGGQRWGLSKYYSAQHNGATALQKLSSIAQATVGASISDAFTQDNGVLATTNWYLMKMATYPNWTADTTHPYVSSNAITHNNTTASGIGYRVGCLHKSAFIEDTDFELTASVTLARHGGAGSISAAGFVIRSAFPSFPISISTEQLAAYVSFGATNVTAHIAGTSVISTIGSGGDYKDPSYWTGGRTLKLVVSGDDFSLYADDVQIESTITNTELKGSLYVGLYIQKGTPTNDSVIVDSFTYTSTPSQSNRNYRIAAVSGGDIFTGTPWGSLQATVGGTNALATSGRVGIQQAFGKAYFCDGVNANYSVLTMSTNTVATWTPTDGTLPVDGTAGARYIALYRGRIVLAGLAADPHNWFMSAATDPLDWNYGATASATMAVAGNSTDAGECPDIITCLAPYSDDLMFIGGDHTLWLMQGDPADRGRIDNISYQTGIAGPDAFAFDPNGIFYFFGSGTVWRMAAGGVPEPLSRNRMDAAFKAIDLTTNTVHLAWDNVRHGLFIFIVPKTEGATTHYYWDERTDGFWKITFPNAHGPTTVLRFDGDDPDDNALILGGFDGYLRKIDPSVKDDDGTAVSSYILYPPISRGGSLRNTRINGITAILDTDSDDVVLTAFAEDTIQKVMESATSTTAAVNITVVSQVNKTFTVAEDWSARKAGDRLLVAGSTGNDGSYTLASLTGAGPTVLTVHGAIPHATANGTIQYKDRAKLTRTLSAPRTRTMAKIASNAIMFKLSNSVDEKAWAIESLVAEVEVIGRTRKNQL